MFTFIGFTGWLKNVFAMYEVFMKKHKKKVKIHEISVKVLLLNASRHLKAGQLLKKI